MKEFRRSINTGNTASRENKVRRSQNPAARVWDTYKLRVSSLFLDNNIPREQLPALKEWTYMRHQFLTGELDSDGFKERYDSFNDRYGKLLDTDPNFGAAVKQITELTALPDKNKRN